uniref:Uncharacterized protein n=1 Tax=Nelumbo nucifera TaxID=4432 RepID=A0A822YRY5_NELNU|nr:TPA_asm: hypothetical protein HUJ06_007575 [Nelumbo nucifera]
MEYLNSFLANKNPKVNSHQLFVTIASSMLYSWKRSPHLEKTFKHAINIL